MALAVVTVSTQDRLNTVQAQNGDHRRAGGAGRPDRHRDHSTGGNATVVLSSRSKDDLHQLRAPRLPNAKVYELWLLSTGSAVPAGLLSPAADGKTAPVLATGLTSADKVGVTVEPAGGTSPPTTTPILVMTLPG